jgi:Fur family transcriptional regulator, ferric uptake regulator
VTQRAHAHGDHRHGDLLHKDALYKEVAARLLAAGQRFTTNRRTIVDALIGGDRPLSIPEILESTRLPQSSLYRNLTVLEAANVVTRVITTDEWGRFELSEELTGHHHHLVCSQCGAVTDVTIPDDVESDLDRALEKLATRAGFELSHHRLDLVGLCASCQLSQTTRAQPR